MKNIRILAAVILVCTLAACGGGGSSPTSFLPGNYIDEPTIGIKYRTSSGISGTTTAAGFNYAAGDTVTFYITSADGSVEIPLGTYTPVNASTSAANAAPVLSYAINGCSAQITQIVQSLATASGISTNRVLSLTNVSLSNTDATTIKDYIQSCGEKTAPADSVFTGGTAGVLVNLDKALYEALKFVSIGGIAQQTVADSSQFVAGKTYFSNSTYTVPGTASFHNGNINYFKEDGNYYSLCTNLLFYDTVRVANAVNVCSRNNGQPNPGVNVFGTGTWTVAGLASNSFRMSGIDWFNSQSFTQTVTAPVMDAYKGAFNVAQTNNGTLDTTGTSVGKYQNVQSDFSITSLINKEVTITGSMGRCASGGSLKYVFDTAVTGTGATAQITYTTTCSSYNAGFSAVTGVAKNAYYGSSVLIPGVVKLKDDSDIKSTAIGGNLSTYPLYIGLTADSTATSGTVMVAKAGDNSACALTDVTTQAKCGFVKAKTFTVVSR